MSEAPVTTLPKAEVDGQLPAGWNPFDIWRTRVRLSVPLERGEIKVIRADGQAAPPTRDGVDGE